jgi:hypothetical protein
VPQALDFCFHHPVLDAQNLVLRALDPLSLRVAKAVETLIQLITKFLLIGLKTGLVRVDQGSDLLELVGEVLDPATERGVHLPGRIRGFPRLVLGDQLDEVGKHLVFYVVYLAD